MKAGDKFNFGGKEYWFTQESRRNGGGTHFFAQEVGCTNVKMRQIAYADLIIETAKTEKLNPRFVAFNILTGCEEKGMVRNSEFMGFVSRMISFYATSKGGEHSAHKPFHIQDQDDFTKFIASQPKIS